MTGPSLAGARGCVTVAYFMCNSVPTDVRRANEEALISVYRRTLESHGATLDEATGREPVPAVLGVLVDCRHLHRRNGIQVAANRN